MTKSSVNSNRSYSEAQTSMSYLPNYYRWIYKKFGSFLSGDIWDIGCGSGHIIQFYLSNPRVSSIAAVDQDEECTQNLRNKYSEAFHSGRIRVVNSDIFSFVSQDNASKADVVILLDVLEHIDDGAFLKSIKGFIRPGGKLILKVPAGSRLYSDVDERSGHFRRYDPQPFKKNLLSHGYRIQKLEYMNPVGRFVYKYKSQRSYEEKSNFSDHFSTFTLQIINVSMLLLPAFDVFQLPGLSLIAVAEVP